MENSNNVSNDWLDDFDVGVFEEIKAKRIANRKANHVYGLPRYTSFIEETKATFSADKALKAPMDIKIGGGFNVDGVPAAKLKLNKQPKFNFMFVERGVEVRYDHKLFFVLPYSSEYYKVKLIGGKYKNEWIVGDIKFQQEVKEYLIRYLVFARKIHHTT